jgi:hypothetical protein
MSEISTHTSAAGELLVLAQSMRDLHDSCKGKDSDSAQKLAAASLIASVQLGAFAGAEYAELRYLIMLAETPCREDQEQGDTIEALRTPTYRAVNWLLSKNKLPDRIGDRSDTWFPDAYLALADMIAQESQVAFFFALGKDSSYRAAACRVPQSAVEIAAAINEWRESHYEFIGARTECVPFQQDSREGLSCETGEEERVQSRYRTALYRLMAASNPIFHLCAACGISSTAIRRRLDNPRNGDLSTSNEADYVIAELEAHLRAKVPIGASDPGRKAEPNRLEVSDNGNGSYTALFAGKTHPLNESKYAYLKKLLDAKGGFYSPPNGSNERPDRLRKSLPLELQAIIEAKDGSGTRLTIF